MENSGVRFLPKNTTSVIRLLDQGVIIASDWLYRKRFLVEVLVVLDNKTDENDDKKGQIALEFLRNYTLISSISNYAAAWKAVKSQMFENG
jgi:hypothetical protein